MEWPERRSRRTDAEIERPWGAAGEVCALAVPGGCDGGEPEPPIRLLGNRPRDDAGVMPGDGTDLDMFSASGGLPLLVRSGGQELDAFRAGPCHVA